MASPRFLPALRGRFEPAEESKALGIAFANYYADLATRGIVGRGTSWPVERAVVEGFDRVIWVFKSVTTIGADSARLKYVLKQGDEVVDDHPMYRLLNKKANPVETGNVFRKRLSAQVLLSKRGAFVQVGKSNRGTPIRLDLLPPDRTEPIPADDGSIDHFRLTRRNGTIKNLEPHEVRWFRDPHPLDPYMGVTPLEAAGMSVELDHFARLYNVTFMQNDGRPGGVLAVRKTDGQGGDIDPKQMDRIESKFGKGPVEAGKLSVIAGDLSYVDLAARPRDMQYGETSRNAKIEVLSAFGVPESVLGYSAERTYDNADAELYTYWTRTLPAHHEILLAGFDEDSEDDLEGEFDTSKIEVLERAEKAKREEKRAEVAAGLRSLKSYADAAGYGDEIDDTPHTRALYIPTGKTPLPSKEADAEALGLAPPPGESSAGAAQPEGGEEPGQDEGGPGGGAQPPAGGPGGAPAGTPPPTSPAPGSGAPAPGPRASAPGGPTPPAPPAPAAGGMTPGAARAALAAVAGTKRLALPAAPPSKAVARIEVKRAVDTTTREAEPDLAAADALEREVAEVLSRLAERWVERSLARLRSPKQRKGTRHWTPEHPGDARLGTKALDTPRVVDEETWQAEAESALEPILYTAAALVAAKIMTDLGMTPPNAAADATGNIASLAERIVTRTVRGVLTMVRRAVSNRARLLSTTIATADQDGESLDVIQDLVRDFGDKMPGWAGGLAVATTTGLVNGAADDGAREVNRDDDVSIVRVWFSRRDEKVRLTHQPGVGADGQVRGLDEPFVVGGVLLMRPGDPTAPLSETANCRCFLRYRSTVSGRWTARPQGKSLREWTSMAGRVAANAEARADRLIRDGDNDGLIYDGTPRQRPALVSWRRAATPGHPLGTLRRIGTDREGDQAAVNRIAAAAHDDWRRARDYAPRMKPDGRGGQVDIANTDFEHLPPQWQRENRLGAEAALAAARAHGGRDADVEAVAADVHESWLTRNRDSATEEQAGPYADLSEAEKDKDRVFAREAIRVLGGDPDAPDDSEDPSLASIPLYRPGDTLPTFTAGASARAIAARLSQPDLFDTSRVSPASRLAAALVSAADAVDLAPSGPRHDAAVDVFLDAVHDVQNALTDEDDDDLYEALGLLAAHQQQRKALPRDADGDGFIYDGTPRQRPALPRVAIPDPSKPRATGAAPGTRTITDGLDTPLDYRGKFPGQGKRMIVTEVGANYGKNTGNWEGAAPDTVGYLDYSVVGDEVYVWFMTTRFDREKQGIAGSLVQALYDAHPDKRIEWGDLMDDGAEILYKRFKASHPEQTGHAHGTWQTGAPVDPELAARLAALRAEREAAAAPPAPEPYDPVESRWQKIESHLTGETRTVVMPDGTEVEARYGYDPSAEAYGEAFSGTVDQVYLALPRDAEPRPGWAVIGSLKVYKGYHGSNAGGPQGKINYVRVSDRFRRQGIATDLLSVARDLLPYPVDHYDIVTGSGQAWADAVKALRVPRDGDGDGRVYDGTPREMPAPLDAIRSIRKVRAVLPHEAAIARGVDRIAHYRSIPRAYGGTRLADANGARWEDVQETCKAIYTPPPFTTRTGRKVSVTAEWVDHATSEDGSDLYIVTGTLHDEDGELGMFERSIQVDADGTVTAHHDGLGLDRGQGEGIASEFNAHALAWYREMGVDRIKVQAVGSLNQAPGQTQQIGSMVVHTAVYTGGYAWGEQGFDFDKASFGNTRAGVLYGVTFDTRIRDQIARYDELPPGEQMDVLDLVGSVVPLPDEFWHSPEQRAALLDFVRKVNPATVTPWEINQVGRDLPHFPDAQSGDETWLGKALMVRSSWYGIFDMSWLDAYPEVKAVVRAARLLGMVMLAALGSDEDLEPAPAPRAGRKDLPRDADADGRIYDGTAREMAAPVRILDRPNLPGRGPVHTALSDGGPNSSLVAKGRLRMERHAADAAAYDGITVPEQWGPAGRLDTTTPLTPAADVEHLVRSTFETTFTTRKGRQVSSHVTEHLVSPAGRFVKVKGEIRDADGAVLGHFERTLTAGTANEWAPAERYVTHANLRIEPSARGEGIGAEFNAHAFAMYRRIGYDEVQTIAGGTRMQDDSSPDHMNGGYVWATQGFVPMPRDPSKRSTPFFETTALSQALNALQSGDDAKVRELLTWNLRIPESWVTDENLAWLRDSTAGMDPYSPPTPYDLAMLGVDRPFLDSDTGEQTWFGKAAMSRITWSGRFDLRWLDAGETKSLDVAVAAFQAVLFCDALGADDRGPDST